MEGRSSFKSEFKSSINEVTNVGRNLKTIRIGDSHLINSTTSPEEKFAEYSKDVNNSLQFNVDSNNFAESAFIDGQGDINVQSSESSINNELATIEEISPQNLDFKFTKEAINESPCFLRDAIEELETFEAKFLKKSEKNCDLDFKENIASWEENEEEFLRIINALELEKSIYNTSFESEEINEDINRVGEMLFSGEDPKLSSYFSKYGNQAEISEYEVSEGPNISSMEEISSTCKISETFEKIPNISECKSSEETKDCFFSKSSEEMKEIEIFSEAEEILSPPSLKLLPPTIASGSEFEANYTRKSAKAKKGLGNKLRKLVHFIFGHKKQ